MSFSLPNVSLWSPEAPSLYSLSLRLIAHGQVVSESVETFGFRSVHVAGGRICLNDKPIELKGMCYVFDDPVHGLVMTEEQLCSDVAAIKQLGCNAVRCHYPMDRRFYDVCDREGLLVWIEPTIYCLHPAMEETNTPFADPQDAVRQKASGVPPEPIDLSPMREMLDAVLSGSGGHIALLLTEFGADSVAGFRSRSLDLWSEDYHAALIEEIFDFTDQYPQIEGTFPFCLTDYRDPSKVPNGYWDEWNLKGVLTYERKRKMAFEAIRRAYSTK